MIKIYTDATSNLTKATENLEILPLLFSINEKKYLTNELEPKEIYNYLSQGIYPKTSRPNLGIWSEVIEKDLKEGNDILYIGPTNKITSITSSINIIKNLFKDKYTHNISLLNTNYIAGVTPLIIEDVLDKGDSFIYKDENYSNWFIVRNTFTIFNNNRFNNNIDRLSLLKVINGKLEYHSSYDTYHDVINFIESTLPKGVNKIAISYSYDMNKKDLLSEIQSRFKPFTKDITFYEMNSCIYSYLGIGSLDVSIRYN